MKKFLSVFCAVLLGGALVAGLTACGENGKSYSVYAPDGAPALALVNAIHEGDGQFSYHVVDSSTITGYVTGESPAADFCVLPLNAASKLLGSGETYRLLGSVTNGNLYFLSTGGGDALTSANLTALVGKTVGVVQLANVPGLTLQATLFKYGIPYQTISALTADKATDKVNLLAVEATNVTPAYGCDYYLCPEPAATTKITATAAAAKPFVLAGDLQELYGGGYPQAALVAKKSVLEADSGAVNTLIGYMAGGKTFLQSASGETVLNLLDGKRTEGLAPAFNANNLNATVIANCSVSFTAAKDAKTKINTFLSELIAVNANAAKAVSDAFFYEG